MLIIAVHWCLVLYK